MPALPDSASHTLGRTGSLGLIVLLHIGIFYALQIGLSREAVRSAPQEVMASFIISEPAAKPQPPAPTPPAPKPEPVKKAVPKPAAKPAPTPLPTPTRAPKAEPSQNAPSAAPTPEPPAAAAPSAAAAAPAAPATSAAPAVPAPPKTVSGVEYIQAPQAEYPPLARRMSEEGKVLMRVLVNEKGRAERVEVTKSSGSDRLDQAARQAVLRAVFKPYLEDGRPIAVFVNIPINFSINQ